MRRLIPCLAGLIISVLMIGLPLGYKVYVGRTYRNFRTVKARELYRSGQMTLPGLKSRIEEHGIRTVITLRDANRPGELPPDWDEEQFCRKNELYYYRLSPKNWLLDDGSKPAMANVDQFLAILDDPKHYPILIHCFAGEHRTGAFCAIYRMEREGWSNAKAMNELFANGYENLYEEKDIRGFLESYVPRSRRIAATLPGHEHQDQGTGTRE